ncbi:AAA domain-containing protein [Duganella sp. FT135W]|uniref:AAA domain-containing protein n=1 Tax=Duganella flavida TaxID=2692175 RepID=A0A6L8K5E5_9BURK|nr:sigma-54 dependent transcriptional regulator [Duganella flavida]MYM22719.1 AAA domain-containing protein [Duganella flavida]
MTDSLITLPEAAEHAISIRAKALTFEDPRSRLLLERVRLVAPSDATALIIGESGTGKELVARLLHTLSGRGQQPFVAVNCGALSESLIESELFGHEKGAFTGAATSKPGWFEAADGGTLFLDEVGDLPPSAQVKLLRVLQEREVVRVGSRQPRKVDLRLVAATNVNLEAAVQAGRFREDLYYRLNVARLALPPLRERTGDILPLARHFLEQYAKRLRIAAPELTPTAQQRMLAHAWPGNIRELENVIHYAMLVCRNGRVEAADLQFSALALRRPEADAPAAAAHVAATAPAGTAPSLEQALLELFQQAPPGLWQHIEETVFRTAYEYCEGNQVQTSRLLDLSRNIVRARTAQFGIHQTAQRTF